LPAILNRSVTLVYALHAINRIYENQLALEAALMELTLLVESQGNAEAGDNVREALGTIGENAGHIKQGLARLKQTPGA
jgi:hypothetical protein